jgi:hypothetical protein
LRTKVAMRMRMFYSNGKETDRNASGKRFFCIFAMPGPI